LPQFFELRSHAVVFVVEPFSDLLLQLLGTGQLVQVFRTKLAGKELVPRRSNRVSMSDA
jgi:hypothetical protein